MPVTVLTVGLGLIFNSMAGFALSRLRWKGRTVVLALVVATLIVPFETIAVPMVYWVNQLPTLVLEGGVLKYDFGWLNTYQGILLPGLASAFGTFLFRQHFRTLPISILEAAALDGAGHWRRLWRFVVPISLPTISAVALVSLVAEWNDYLWPFLVVDNAEMMTLPLGLTLLQNIDGMNNWGLLMAATVLVTLPMLAVFLILQRRLVAGLTAGAVTG